VLFIATGIGAFAWPGRTFLVLANLVAWFLLFKWTLDIVVAFAMRPVDLWWVQLIAGVLNVVIAFWAAGYPGRSIVLLILWVGISGLTRGVAELALAFQLRGLRGRMQAPSAG
jgi:uncharacterized membrane protein HdeD (DUF308 family)